MRELSFQDCQEVGGGSAGALIGFVLTIINNAGPIREFADGFFDGYGRI